MKTDLDHSKLSCRLRDDVKGLSCFIQAVYESEENCSYSYSEMIEQNVLSYTSDTVDISYIPRSEVYCFVAVATDAESIFTMILVGTFSSTGTSGMFLTIIKLV